MLGKLLDKLLKGPEPESHPVFTSLYKSIETFIFNNEKNISIYHKFSLKGCKEYQTLKSLDATDKIEAMHFLLKQTNYLLQFYNPDAYGHKGSDVYVIHAALLDALMRTKFEFVENYSFSRLFDNFYMISGESKKNNIELQQRPFTALAIQMEKHKKRFGLTDQLKKDTLHLLASPIIKPYIDKTTQPYSWGHDIDKAVKRLQQLLIVEGENDSVPPFELGNGRCGILIQHSMAELTDEKKAKWYILFHHLHTASAGKPTKKFLQKAKSLIDLIGATEFKSQVNKWFNQLGKISIETSNQARQWSGKEYTDEIKEYIEPHNFNLLKGLLWSMSRFNDHRSLQAISTFTEKCFQKIPGAGPAAAGVGNAGIYTLARSKGLAGISHLSHLKVKIQQNNTQKLIQDYIDTQATKHGLRPVQIEEISAADYGLIKGEKITLFDDYQLVLRLISVGKMEFQWIKPNGKTQKSVPTLIKNKDSLSRKLADFFDLARQIKQTSITQRDRIDRLFTEGLCWSLEESLKYYINHGLISPIASRLIWQIEDTPALYINGTWLDVNGKKFDISKDALVTLWHPINATTEQVEAWHERLDSLQLTQPLKQAYRETYLLTDVEINAQVYSNRMAAHILKQHQFNSLAAVHGWKCQLIGAYDDGKSNPVASKLFPEYRLTAELWANPLINDTGTYNDAVICNCVTTDQIRFCNNNDRPVALIDVPKLVFSEVMRDVDLFVEVASIGNDPPWQKGAADGRQDYLDYWYEYSFGELTEIAKTRKQIFERLLPRLELTNFAKIEGNFLVVQGKLNQYKIHIGNGNVLLSPGDKYICIVTGRKQERKVKNLFLPFEGDNGLSVILSKAFLLADDDKITDPTILNQL